MAPAALRSFHHSAFPAERVAAERRASISVCIPAREEAPSIAAVLRPLVALRDQGVIDQLVVVDADSRDGTGEIAASAGAEVHAESALLPEHGPVLGKGDALWRSLSVLRGEVVCFLDADTEGLGEHFALGLAGAVACEPGLAFAKARYRRPFRVGDVVLPEGGGRVTELMARPLLRRFYPELAAFRQPLAGELAARRDLLVSLPFATGYAVEIAMLIDAWAKVGLEGMGEVDLDVRQNRHQPLAALSPMASAVLDGVLVRLAREGRLRAQDAPEVVERPPLDSIRAAA
jgi:glucosyl-3-phosphoglycerate synthase